MRTTSRLHSRCLQQHQRHALVEQEYEYRAIVLRNVEDKPEDFLEQRPNVGIDAQHELERVRIG